MLPDALLQFAQTSGCGGLAPEEYPVNLDGAVPPGSPDHHRVPLFVPFQEGPRSDTQFPANFNDGQHGKLPVPAGIVLRPQRLTIAPGAVGCACWIASATASVMTS